MKVTTCLSHCRRLRLCLPATAILAIAFATLHAAGFAKPALTLEQKLKVLADCGFEIARPFTVADLLKISSRKTYEEPGWYMLLGGMGSAEEQKPWRPLCKNLWDLDVKCIEDNGDYITVAKRMAEMTQGSLVLKDVKDHVDVMKGEAWLSFAVKGRPTRIDCRVDGKVMDASVLSIFVSLLKTEDPSKLYVIYDAPGDEEMLIGCVKKRQLQKLNGHGVKFVPLK